MQLAMMNWFGGTQRTNVVFFPELFAQWGAHYRASDARRSIIMSLARLSPRGVEGLRKVSFVPSRN
jgi:hypothetical protein